MTFCVKKSNDLHERLGDREFSNIDFRSKRKCYALFFADREHNFERKNKIK